MTELPLLLNSILPWAIAAAAPLATLWTYGNMKKKSADRYKGAANNFYRAAEQLLASKDPLPEEAVKLTLTASHIIKDRRLSRRMAKRLAKGFGRGESSDAETGAMLSTMTDEQKKLFVQVLAHLVEAVAFSSLRYERRILISIFDLAKSRPSSKFSNTEFTIGAQLASEAAPKSTDLCAA